jgi:hypothetical protein
MNTNMLHSILNYIGLVVGLLCVTDLSGLGFSPETAAMIAPWFLLSDKIIKITVNVFRDGFAGQFKVQPPVEK